MKQFKSVLLAVLACTLSTQLIAAEEIRCPSIQTIKSNAIFVRAKNFTDNIWMMRSNHFRNNDHNWDILFAVNLPEAKSPEEALQLGQAYFQQNVVLKEPVIENSGRFTACYYNIKDTEETYVIFAASPPVNLPSFPTMLINKLLHKS